MPNANEEWPPPYLRFTPDDSPPPKQAPSHLLPIACSLFGGFMGAFVGMFEAAKIHAQPNDDMDYGAVIGSVLTVVGCIIFGVIIGAFAGVIADKIENCNER